MAGPYAIDGGAGQVLELHPEIRPTFRFMLTGQPLLDSSTVWSNDSYNEFCFDFSHELISAGAINRSMDLYLGSARASDLVVTLDNSRGEWAPVTEGSDLYKQGRAPWSRQQHIGDWCRMLVGVVDAHGIEYLVPVYGGHVQNVRAENIRGARTVVIKARDPMATLLDHTVTQNDTYSTAQEATKTAWEWLKLRRPVSRTAEIEPYSWADADSYMVNNQIDVRVQGSGAQTLQNLTLAEGLQRLALCSYSAIVTDENGRLSWVIRPFSYNATGPEMRYDKGMVECNTTVDRDTIFNRCVVTYGTSSSTRTLNESDSQDSYGVRSKSFSLPFIDNSTDADRWGQEYVGRFGYGVHECRMKTDFRYLPLQVGQEVLVTEPSCGLYRHPFVIYQKRLDLLTLTLSWILYYPVNNSNVARVDISKVDGAAPVA